MTEQQSIRDELAETIHEKFNEARRRNGVSPTALAELILASSVIRRIRADAWAECYDLWALGPAGDFPDREENPYL